MKKFVLICLVAVLTCALSLCLLVGCKDSDKEAVLEVGGDVQLLDGVELDYDSMFFDDFTDGVSKDNWYIGKHSWGANGNGGVVPQNVNYTDDGVLVLTGNGEYYTSGNVRGVGQRKDGTLTGAALISKFVTGAGRYEVKMKILPRLGACSAFWTYAYDSETMGNHAIDIELPGGKTTGIISFQNVLNTNYITERENQSQDVSVSEVTDGKLNTLADGQWHTYGFDWYTVENGETFSGETTERDTSLGRVVYYIDGKVTAISDVFVPYYQVRLWLGVWFPNNAGFVGTANFETDCMYVDWVRYTPFKNQAIVEYAPALSGEMASDSEYPSAPVATTLVNKVANGDFEFAAKGATNSGWEYNIRVFTSEETNAMKQKIRDEHPDYSPSQVNDAYNELRKQMQGAAPSAYCTVSDGIGLQYSCGVRVTQIGLVSQIIDSIFEGSQLDFSFAAMGKGTVSVVFLGNGDDMVGEEVLTVDCSDWATFSKDFVAPKGTRRVEIEIFCTGEALTVDDVALRWGGIQ